MKKSSKKILCTQKVCNTTLQPVQTFPVIYTREGVAAYIDFELHSVVANVNRAVCVTFDPQREQQKFSCSVVSKLHVMCMWLFPGPAVSPGYRPRLPDRGEGRLGKSAQCWWRRKLLWFRIPVAASFWSRNRVPGPAGSDWSGLMQARLGEAAFQMPWCT